MLTSLSNEDIFSLSLSSGLIPILKVGKRRTILKVGKGRKVGNLSYRLETELGLVIILLSPNYFFPIFSLIFFFSIFFFLLKFLFNFSSNFFGPRYHSSVTKLLLSHFLSYFHDSFLLL